MHVSVVSDRSWSAQPSRVAFTLAEVLIAVMVTAVLMGGALLSYSSALRQTEWSAYSLAAQSIAMQGIELVRAAKWDLQAYPQVDEIGQTNFTVATNVLDIPMFRTNAVFATNYVSIVNISTNPPLKRVRVDCVWMFIDKGPFTNTVVVYRAPDQ